MNKLLILSALSIVLLSGSAYAQSEATGAAGATGSGSVSTDGGGLDAGAAAGATGTVDGSVGDTTATGSVNVDANASASADSGFMDGLGDSADDFFTGDDNSELRSDEEITASFEAMTDDEQNELRTTCTDVTANTDGYGPAVVEFCAKIGSMNM